MRHKELQELSPSAMTAGVDRIRRASYYVWFLGAEECTGLRGSDVVKPVVQYLVGKEREQEPEKVTLQVSSRGIKLLQQGSSSRASSVSKHFIPASALTWVQQETVPDDDIVSAVLLIYNPLTRCPVHVHVYRCDSTETAHTLRTHLTQLLHRPQQQAKLSALEARLAARGILPSSRGSDGASTGSSISSGAGSGSGGRGASGDRMAILYDSLAAELREKLGGCKQSPLLLPPKDYETNATRKRRSAQHGVCDPRKGHEDDSARSSGIGSDDAPSPTNDREYGPPEPHQSSSDEEWATHEADEAPLEGPLVPNPWKSRPSHHRGLAHSPSPRRGRKQSPQGRNAGRTSSPIRLVHQRAAPPPRRGRKSSRDRSAGDLPSQLIMKINESPVSPRERFQDARDKFLSLERDREWQLPSHDSTSRGPESFSRGHEVSKRTNETSVKGNSHEGNGRTPSWELGGRNVSRYQHQESRKSRNYRESKDGKDVRDRDKNSRNYKRESYSSREDLIWPKSDRDTGYGSRDGLLKDKKGAREWDKGYGTYDTRDSEQWHKEGHRTPDVWEHKPLERDISPIRGRPRSPNREYRVPQIKSTDRQEYHRAKSMHDLSHKKLNHEEDHRRRSMYDAIDDHPSLRDSRKGAHHFHSHANLPRPASSCSSSSDSTTSRRGYNELPDNQRFPGLDRATARPDPLDHPLMRSVTSSAIGKTLKTFDYPVNGGCAPIQISRTHHDDYRRFGYDHQNPQFIRSTSVPANQY